MTEITIKSAGEIESLRLAGAILTETLNLLEATVKPGVSTEDLDKIAEEFIRSHDGATPGFKGYHGFTGALCTSINHEVVHGIPSDDRILEDGDIIGIDCGVMLNKLHTDACRTVIVGQVDPEIKKFVDTTKKALEMSIRMAKPGGHVGDISAVIQGVLEDAGYTPVVECAGHGVGYSLHEAPEILNRGKKGTGPEIKQGMVFAIEPIAVMGTGEIYTSEDKWTILSRDHSLSSHFENTVVIGEKGPEIIAY